MNRFTRFAWFTTTIILLLLLASCSDNASGCTFGKGNPFAWAVWIGSLNPPGAFAL
jgi:hypothetical protein